MDEKEEGEISLDDVSDVSSSEDVRSYEYTSSWCPSTRSRSHPKKVDIILKDPAHGKENRRSARDIVQPIKYTMPTLQEKNDERLNLSGDDDLEIVCVPGSSRQIVIPCIKKRSKKKKKKKPGNGGGGGDFNFSIDDFVSVVDDEDQIVVSHTEAQRLLSRRRRTPSPVNKRKRSPQSRTNDYYKSPSKNHRSTFGYRTPPKYSRSPSPKRRSPRRARSPTPPLLPPPPPLLLSPKKSSSSTSTSTNITHDKTSFHHRKKDDSSNQHDSDNYDELYATSLLKKVKHLDAAGSPTKCNKQKEASSLKEKLNNMMKVQTEIIENKIDENIIKEKNNVKIEVIEDEEDLEMLRKQALETTNQKTDSIDLQNDIESKNNNQSEYNNIDDNDEEDLELRMIALRSAVMNKHQNRVKKGGNKKSRSKKRDGSPFSDSFFNQSDINKNNYEINSATSSITLSPVASSQQAEDMELDSDVERQKEDIYSRPYSPTDDIVPLTSIDNDVHQNKINSSLDITPIKIFDSSTSPQYGTPYSPSDPPKTPWVDRFDSKSIKKKLSFLDLSKNDNIQNVILRENNSEGLYSPTDSLINISFHDKSMNLQNKLTHATPMPLSLNFNNSSNCLSYQQNLVKIPLEQDPVQLMAPEILREISSLPNDSDEIHNSPNKEKNPLSNFDLVDKAVINLCDSVPSNIIQDKNIVVDEPLYLQGVPDITKDANKIPTSINKSLVPITILKTNKNLQQPLPIKKLEQIPEPTFKSAEMKIVNLVTEKHSQSNAIFKPIKIQQVIKKPTVIASSAAAFDVYSIGDTNIEDTLNDNSTTKNDDNTEFIIPDICETFDYSVKEISQVTENNVDNIKQKNKISKSNKKFHDKEDNTETIVDKNNEKNLLLNNENILPNKNKENEKIQENNDQVDLEKREEKLREKLESKKRKRSKSDRSEKHSPSKLNDDLVRKKLVDKNSITLEVVEKNQNDDKRRRLSMEDDEEALRALLLASLSKRSKNSENLVPIKGSEVSVPQNIEKKIVENESTKKSIVVENLPKILPTSNVLPSRELVLPLTNTTTLVPINATKVIDKNVDKPLVTAPVVSEVKKLIDNLQNKNVRKVILPSIPSRTVNAVNKIPTTTTTTALGTGNVISTLSVLRNKTINNVRLNENIRATSPKLSSARSCRLVINLGEDSDSDTDSEYSNNSDNVGSNELKDDSPVPTPDFEKSVEAFLRDQRKKIESVVTDPKNTSKKPATSTPKASTGKKTTGFAPTPLAVRHLSASRQEEYRRLKQQLLDREAKKLERTIKNLGNKINNISGGGTTLGPLSPASPVTKPSKLAPAKTLKNPGADGEIAIVSKDNPLKIVSNKTTKIPTVETPIIDKENAQIYNKIVEVDTSCSLSKTLLESAPKNSDLSVEIIDENTLNIQCPKEIEKSIVPEEALVKTIPVLKILTTEQLNKKFDEQNQFKKIELHNSNKLNQITQNKLIVDNSLSSVKKSSSINTASNILVNKISQIEKSKVISIETIKSVPSAKVVVTKTPTTVVLPSVELNKKQSNTNTNLNSTITLDDSQNVNQDTETESQTKDILVTPTKKSPVKIKKKKSPARELSDKIKLDIKVELENLISLSEEEKKEGLSKIEKKLITNRFLVLDDLTKMSENLKQWDVERELETELTGEVRRLRMQLKIAENRLQEQRTKIANMGPKIVKAHKTIINGRAKCLKLTKLCQGIGSKVVGPRYKVPSIGAQQTIDSLKDVVFHTRQLSQKTSTGISNDLNSSTKSEDENKTSLLNNLNIEKSDKVASQSDDVLDSNLNTKSTEQSDNSISVVENTSTTIEKSQPAFSNTSVGCDKKKMNSPAAVSVDVKSNDLEPEQSLHNYESVLSIFDTQGHIDPNGVLCPFELMGTCSDDGCSYNHFDSNRGR